MQVARLQSRLEAAEAAQAQGSGASSTLQEQIAALKSNISDLEKVLKPSQCSIPPPCFCSQCGRWSCMQMLSWVGMCSPDFKSN